MTFFEFISEWWFLVVAIATGIAGFVAAQVKIRTQIAALEKTQLRHDAEDHQYHKELIADIRKVENELRSDIKELEKRSHHTETTVSEIKVKLDLMFPMIEALYKHVSKK